MIALRTHLENHSAVVLHSYNYRNSSLIVNFFLKEYGKVSAIAKGVKGKKAKANTLSLLQPFQTISVSLTGKQELLIVKNVEAIGIHWELSGKALYCAYYLNELLLRLLVSHTDCSNIFLLYKQILNVLSQDPENYEAPLRIFELKLLEFLGYGLNLAYDSDSDHPVDSDKTYFYCLGAGASEKKPLTTESMQIAGKTLLDMSRNQLSDPKTLQQSKQLLKWVLAEHLGHKPLKSREIYKQLYATH